MKKIFTTILLLTNLFQFAKGQGTPANTSFHCGTLEDNINVQVLKTIQNAQVNQTNRLTSENLREVRLAIVVDSTVYFAFQKDTNAIKETLFKTIRNASKIYEQALNIRLSISYLEFSSKNRQYNSLNGTYDAFNKFEKDYSQRKDIRRDIMMLWSIYKSEPYSGLASSVGGIASNPSNATIHCTFANYDLHYSVELVAHEVGHILGSPHTHSCHWANGPFEICSDEINDASCPHHPLSMITGSIMSYCLQVGSNGLPFFHPLCIDVIQKVTYPIISPMTIAPQTAPTVQNGLPNNDYFLWSAVEKITGYEAMLSDKIDFSTTVLDTLLEDNTFVLSKTLKLSSTYYFKVRAKNQVGSGPWSALYSFTTRTATQLTTPILNLIDDSKACEDQIISFKPVNDATGYVLQFFTSPTATQVFFEKQVKQTSLRIGDITGLLQGYQYTWHVKAVRDTLSGPWSNSQTFYYCIKGRFSNTFLSQANQSNGLVNSTLTFKTNFSPFSADITYYLDIAETSDFKKILQQKKIRHSYINESIIALTGSTGIDVDSLAPQKQYYFRFKAQAETDSVGWISSSFVTNYEQRWKTWSYQNSILPFGPDLYSSFIDKQNNLWVFGEVDAFKVSPAGTMEKFEANSPQNVTLVSMIVSLKANSKNQVWFNTPDGFSVYDAGKWIQYPGKLWAGDDGINNWVVDMVFNDKNTLFFRNVLNRIFQYDGNTWKEITTGIATNAVSNAKLRVDNEGTVWLNQTVNNVSTIRTLNGSQWTILPLNWDFLTNHTSFFYDNEDTFYYLKGDSLFSLKNKNSYESLNLKGISAIDDQTGKVITLTISPISIYKANNHLYITITLNGSTKYLETDGKTWWLRQFLGGVWANANAPAANIVVDNNGKVITLQNNNIIATFDAKDIIANFTQKTVTAGCSFKFKVGITSPPSGTAEQNNLKVFLSDSSSTTFKQVTASYLNGEVTVSIPKNLYGKGYRFKYTMGNNWLESKESSPFDITNTTQMAQITGQTYYCYGNSTTLTASADASVSPLSFQWLLDSKNVESTSTITVSQPGSYSVMINDALGCTFQSPVFVVTERKLDATVTPNSPPIVYEPNIVKLTATALDSASYQWQNNGIAIMGATQNTYDAKETGNYSVKITAKGCTLNSNVVKVDIEKVLSFNRTLPTTGIEMAVSPNPSSGIVKISINTLKTLPLDVTLTDIQGKPIEHYQLDNKTNSTILTIDLSKKASGVYLLKVQNTEGRLVKQIVKE